MSKQTAGSVSLLVQTDRDSITHLNMARLTQSFAGIIVWPCVSRPVLASHHIHQTVYNIALHHSWTVSTHVSGTVLLDARRNTIVFQQTASNLLQLGCAFWLQLFATSSPPPPPSSSSSSSSSLLSLTWSLTTDSAKTLGHALIASRLDYCNGVLTPPLQSSSSS